MEKGAAGCPSLPLHYGLTNPGTSRTSPAAYPTSSPVRRGAVETEPYGHRADRPPYPTPGRNPLGFRQGLPSLLRRSERPAEDEQGGGRGQGPGVPS